MIFVISMIITVIFVSSIYSIKYMNDIHYDKFNDCLKTAKAAALVMCFLLPFVYFLLSMVVWYEIIKKWFSW